MDDAVDAIHQAFHQHRGVPQMPLPFSRFLGWRKFETYARPGVADGYSSDGLPW
jgi:hypothetical protein